MLFANLSGQANEINTSLTPIYSPVYSSLTPI